MACISCGVITSAWLCRNSSLCVSAMLRCNIGPVLALTESSAAVHRGHANLGGGVNNPLPQHWLHPEFLAQIQPAHFGVVDDVVGVALAQHLTRVDDVGAVGQAERLAHIV